MPAQLDDTLLVAGKRVFDGRRHVVGLERTLRHLRSTLWCVVDQRHGCGV